MKCENVFCIYYKKGECSLDEIEIDIQGSCCNCIYIRLSEDDLKKMS